MITLAESQHLDKLLFLGDGVLAFTFAGDWSNSYFMSMEVSRVRAALIILGIFTITFAKVMTMFRVWAQ